MVRLTYSDEGEKWIDAFFSLPSQLELWVAQ